MMSDRNMSVPHEVLALWLFLSSLFSLSPLFFFLLVRGLSGTRGCVPDLAFWGKEGVFINYPDWGSVNKSVR